MQTLRLFDGSEIDLRTGKLVGDNSFTTTQQALSYIEVPTNSEAVHQVLSVRRRLADLPDVPKHMNTVSIVLAYKLFGLENDDIAIATGLTEQQVGNVLLSDAYSRMHDTVLDSIRESDTSTVRGLMSAASLRAAKKLVAFTQDDSALGLAAVKDVLDRAGHRPADIVEHRHRMEGGLVIEYVKKDHTSSAPMINITPEDD
jgi:hypothetical protein